MRPKASRAGLLIFFIVVAAAVPATATAQPSSKDPLSKDRPQGDPWSILDGAYFPPQTPPLPFPEAALEEPGVAEPSVEEQLVLRGEWSALAETYRQSLERLGDEDRGVLLEVVADLEVAAIAGQPERRMPRLARVELQVAQDLANRDPEILVPIFQLHHDLYLEHRRARQWYLLLHSTSMVEELATLYVEKAGSQGARINAARILASLAGHQQAAQQPASIRLFRRVLELDPSNETAYLGLAAHHEKRGGPFEPVIEHLQDLLEVYPDHREGRLRLAINHLRLGKTPAGTALLQQLLDEPSSDWVYRLAAQEMARQEAGGGRVGDAIRILENAIENAPGDQKLCIQLAFLYDLNRQSFDSHRIAEMARSGPPAVESPRGRYNMWPHRALERDRRELRRLAESRVQLLARILHDRYPSGRDEPAPREPEVNP